MKKKTSKGLLLFILVGVVITTGLAINAKTFAKDEKSFLEPTESCVKYSADFTGRGFGDTRAKACLKAKDDARVKGKPGTCKQIRKWGSRTGERMGSCGCKEHHDTKGNVSHNCTVWFKVLCEACD